MPALDQLQVNTRPFLLSLLRGWRKHCPNCGIGPIFNGYLRVHAFCPACQEALYHQRADDAPPYFTILTLGHILVPAMLLFEQGFDPPEWLHYILWLPLALILALILLPRFKGALIGLQWTKRMHGFGGHDDQPG